MKNYVTIKDTNALAAMHWVKENCPSYITNRYHQSDIPGVVLEYNFYFAKEEDMAFFALRWT